MTAVLSSLQNAREVSCLAYVLRSGSMLRALEDAARRGARVTVRLEGAPYYDASGGVARVNASAVAALRAAGADAQLTHTDSAQAPQHAKAMVVDHMLYLDETNWSNGDCQTILRDSSRRDVRMVRDAVTGRGDDATRDFAMRKRDALSLESRLIARAPLHDRLDIESESFGTHNSVYAALEAWARRGGVTRLLVTSRVLRENAREGKALATLSAEGVRVRRTNATEKCAVAGGCAWIGSANASAAFARPDQLDWGAKTSVASVVRHERSCFDQRWSRAQSETASAC